MAYQNINFPTLRLVHGLKKEIGQSTKIISNGNTEYRLSKSQARRRWTFPARALTLADRNTLIGFMKSVDFALDSFNFYCPIEKLTYKVRFESSAATSVVESMDVNGNVTAVTFGDVSLVEVFE